MFPNIDFSYDQSVTNMTGFLGRVTNAMRQGESWVQNISRITGELHGLNLAEDEEKIIQDLLKNENIFDNIDMNADEEEDEKLFLILDKETGKIFDIRNEYHLQKVQELQAKHNSETIQSSNPYGSSEIDQTKACTDWWKQKRQNN